MVAPLLYRADTGEPATTVAQAAGVYASERPPFEEVDAAGRRGITFRAFSDWASSTEEHPMGLPLGDWPSWHRVDFDAQQALTAFLLVRDRASALAFATTYGPLWACTRHPFPCLWRGVPRGVFGSECEWVNSEPLDWWLDAAKRVRGVVSAVQTHNEGRSLATDQWRAMGYLPPETPYGRGEGLLISSAVNGELQRYGVHVGVRWDLETLEIDAGIGFLPAIWQQLATVIAGGRAMAICSACANAYFRRIRAPKRGQRNYCLSCRSTSAPQRLSRKSRTARG